MPDLFVNEITTLGQLKREYEDCNRCTLCARRTQVVCWDGPETSPIFVCGEAPGAVEDDCGLPFSGPAGKRLDILLKAVGTHRGEIHISNVVWCRPTDGSRNSKPSKAEALACRGRLFKEIELVQPRVLVCLGGYATSIILHHVKFPAPVGPLRGWHKTTIQGKEYSAYVSWHPAYELRKTRAKDYSVNRQMFEDWKKVLEYVPEVRVLT